MIDVLIVDDHELVRQGLRSVLEHEDGLTVVGEASRADEALPLVRKLRPAVVVLDISLPDRDGLGLIADIRQESPDARVLLCSGIQDGTILAKAAAAGADGFVAKESPNTEIVEAIRRVSEGATVVGQETAQAMFRDLRDRRADVAKIDALSDRERAVLGLLADGLTNREIGARLFLSEKTVRNHLSATFRKLSVRHRTEAALFAVPLREHLGPSS